MAPSSQRQSWGQALSGFFSLIARLIFGTLSDASHSAQGMVAICIKMILRCNLFSRYRLSSLFSKANKGQFFFSLGWFVWTAENEKMVDAFINYDNLLNELWQSLWRALFRCRWLPSWLPLSLVELPIRAKRRRLQTVSSDWQSITSAVCVWDWLIDWVTALHLGAALPLKCFWLTPFPLLCE